MPMAEGIGVLLIDELPHVGTGQEHGRGHDEAGLETEVASRRRPALAACLASSLYAWWTAPGSIAFVSRAPQADIERWKARMGWEIPWYTITDDFDADFGVDKWHGTNAFFRDGDRIFRTYSSATAETRRWAALGATSTSRRSDARRSGKTRQRATRRRRPTSGGNCTTSTSRGTELAKTGALLLI
jgi:hypothetical protein